jgi:hypothetical protein
MIRIHQIAAETVPHIFLLQAEAVHLILHPADHQAPRTADPVAIQFLQGAQAVDQCLPDLTAVAADHLHPLHIAADQYQEAVVVPTHQVHLQVHHLQVHHHQEVLHQVAAEDIRRRQFKTIQYN